MAKLVSLLISDRQQRLIAVLLGLLIFAALLCVSALLASREIHATMRQESQLALDHFVRVRANLDSTFKALEERVTAAPCTPEFQNQLRRIAFIPDGFSEFLHAPGGIADCSLSVARFPEPVRLGQPDILPAALSPSTIWVDRGLGFLGLGGLVGSVVLRGDFAIIVPPQKLASEPPPWLGLEVVLRGTDERWWHRAGEVEVYDGYWIAQGPRAPRFETTFRALLCDGVGRYCVATQAPLAAVIAGSEAFLLAAVLAIALVSAWLAARAKALIVGYWSFEARFRRHLDAQSIVCCYQPILDLRSGRIAGCEVLARWRDVDDAIVYPDRFIALVEKHGLTRKFTRLVVRRAFAELSAAIPPDHRLELAFNIFPSDLDAAHLIDIFKVFDAAPGRFDLVAEIVESHQLVIDDAQRQIEALKAAGIRTYIDDFGTGYSNIQNIAALSVDGVKLDRSFAMAPEGSLMARMLGLAIEMIHTSDRAIVVEGVETRERLDLLRRISPPIDYAQGYYISRPLDIAAFAEFLTSRSALPAGLGRAA